MSKLKPILRTTGFSLVTLGIILSFTNPAFACSLVPGFQPKVIEGKGLFIQTSSILGPNYTNLNEYIPIRRDMEAPCGPRTTYIKALPVYGAGAVVAFGLIFLGMKFYNKKKRI